MDVRISRACTATTLRTEVAGLRMDQLNSAGSLSAVLINIRVKTRASFDPLQFHEWVSQVGPFGDLSDMLGKNSLTSRPR